MKNIKKYFGLTLIALLFSVVLSACEDKDEIGSDNLGMAIKVFSPTKVVPGQPVTINGSGFGEVTEVVFPGGIAVSNFELVSNEMIRVVTPAGINISDEGEKLLVRSASDQAESPRVMTQGHTQVRAYSAEPGEDVKTKSILKIFGQDMEFVSKATFVGSDDNEIVLEAKDFYRIATGSVAIKVPADVKEGVNPASIETLDGLKFDLPDFNYVAAAAGGHWETVKKYLWKNETGDPIPGWGSTFRFSNVETATGEEIYAFPMEDWAVIKDGTFRVALDVNDASNIRITTGWWTGAYGGNEHNSIDFVQEDEDGTKFIELNFKEEGSLYDNLDQQHMLFTGSDYTLLAIYTQEDVWVEEAEGHWERKSLWKNDAGEAVPAWGGKFRFSNVETSSGEEIYAFPMEDWAIIKDGVVKVAVDVNDASNIRITTGWWTGAYGGDEHNCIDFVQEGADGTKFIELNIKEEGTLYDNLDAQHLLFTGSDYTVLEIYLDVWVEEAGGAKPVVLWENVEGEAVPSWGGKFRFSNVETSSGEEIYAFPMEDWAIIKDGKFRVALDVNESSNIRITTGWWTGAYGGDEHNCIDMVEEDADGTKFIEVNIKEEGSLYDNLDVQHLLFTGSDYTVLKLYYIK